MNNKEFNTVEEMSAYLTHSINTPLTYLKGNLDHMGEDILTMPNGSLKDEFIYTRKKMLQAIDEIEKVVNVVHSVTKNSSV